MKTKSLGWAYPSSEHAKQFGHPKTGCWIIETQSGTDAPAAISGYLDKSAAQEALRLMAEPLNKYSML